MGLGDGELLEVGRLMSYDFDDFGIAYWVFCFKGLEFENSLNISSHGSSRQVS